MNSTSSIDRYSRVRSSLAWVLERKDFNHFWPLGVPEAATAGGPQMALAIEKNLDDLRCVHLPPIENPTTLIILYLYCVFGMRVLNWGKIRRLQFGDALFDMIEMSKHDPFDNFFGCYRLVAWTQNPLRAALHWRNIHSTDDKEFAKEAHRLGAVMWAYAESLYYYNHRIATERHGPYPGFSRGSMITVRSCINLSPYALWPEVNFSGLPLRVHIAGEYCDSEIGFDFFGNPIFAFDVNQSIRKVTVSLCEGEGLWNFEPSIDHLRYLSDRLGKLTQELTIRTEALGKRERAEMLFKVMQVAWHTVEARRVSRSTPLQNLTFAKLDDKWYNSRHEVSGEIGRLLDYYDIRKEVVYGN